MKSKLLALLSAALVLTSCSEVDLGAPEASLITAQPSLSDGVATLTLWVRNYDSEQPLTIPVDFAGTASKGVDYKVSADAFVWGGESPVTDIVITPLVYGTGKTVTATLSLPEGFGAGLYQSSEFRLSDHVGVASFASSRALLTDTTSIEIYILDTLGQQITLDNGGMITVAVNEGESTAKEGTHFSFVGGKTAYVEPGSGKASFRIAPVSDVPAVGNDKIVLELQPEERFNVGFYEKQEIEIWPKELSALDGRWVVDSLVTDSTYFVNFWGDQCTGYDRVPHKNTTDVLTFNLESISLSAGLRSELKYFFIGKSNLARGENISITKEDGSVAELYTFSLDNTNRYFSSEEFSEDSLSYIGVRFVDSLLDLYLIDHQSRTFLPELDSLGLLNPVKPAATAPGTYINALLRKN